VHAFEKRFGFRLDARPLLKLCCSESYVVDQVRMGVRQHIDMLPLSPLMCRWFHTRTRIVFQHPPNIESLLYGHRQEAKQHDPHVQYRCMCHLYPAECTVNGHVNCNGAALAMHVFGGSPTCGCLEI
jgi:hypothetical protein